MFLLLGLLGGLVTGISPCILPVLPALFLGAAGGKETTNAATASFPESPTNAVDPALFRVAPGITLGKGGGTPAVAARKTADNSPSVARRPLLIVAGLVTSFMLITVAGSALLSLLHLPQTAIRWAGIVLLAAVGVGMIVPKVMEILERPFARIAPRTAGDGAGFGLGLVLGAAFVPCAGPVLTSVIVASNNGQFTWRIVGLAISFAVGVSIPLLAVALAGSGMAASLKARQRPLRIAAGVAMIALAIGIATNAPAALQRIIPDYTASLQAGDDEACETGACDPEQEVEARGDFAQCARGTGKDCGTLPALTSSEWINALGQPTGTVTLVDFWSSSCTNCQREIPELERIYEKYKDYGLVVIGVHSPQQAYERDPAVVSGAVSRLGITYPVALDPDLADFQTYGASAWPTHYIAGADEQLVAVGRGTKGVEEQIRALLTEAGASLPD